MSSKDDIAEAYRLDCASPIAVPAWAHLPLCTTEGGSHADGWSVVVTPAYVGPERRAVMREPVLRAHGGARVLPKQAGWLFAARGQR